MSDVAPRGPTDGDRPRRRAFRSLPSWAGTATRLVHGGVRPDLNAGAVVPPVYLTSTFRFPEAYSEATPHGATYLYSRNGNPTVEGVQELVRDLEGGEAARLFASGMGAIAATLLSLVDSGDELVAPAGLYGGTSGLLHGLLPRLGLRVRELPRSVAEEPEASVGPSTRVVFLESPTNPDLRVHDLARWAEVARRRDALLVVDSTLASPVNQNPLRLGADLVVHSATKYLGGHADLTAGAVVGRADLLERIDPHQALGAPLDPFGAFLLHRGLKTLTLRVERANANARAIVDALAGDPAVRRVHYPGRASAEQEAIAARQMRGRGGMVGLSLTGGASAAERLLGRLQIFEVAPSLGGVESLASLPRLTSHRHLPREEREARGIDQGFVRLSAGIEEPADLVRDLREALRESS